MTKIFSPKKLIEVALPLDDINVAAAREKSIRHGHPSTLHLWWARRPLAAARAVIFAQLVNDPGYQQDAGFKYGVNKKEAELKREKLFQIIRDLVTWKNTNNEEVLNRAREAINESWRETCYLNRNHPQAEELFNPDKLPAFHDPFAGGGAIPLEAQRFGLESHASDLNPVAVMINKAMIEIPPKFAGQKPVGPLVQGENQPALMEDWSGVAGLAEDVRRYGHWMREEAFKKIGSLYPNIEITEDMIKNREDLKPYLGQELTVITWLWARSVKSPNPAFSHVEVPLASSFLLSSKKGKEVWLKPGIQGEKYSLDLCFGNPATNSSKGTKSGRGANFNCIVSGTPISSQYIKNEGMNGRIKSILMALVIETKDGKKRFFLDQKFNENVQIPKADWRPDNKLPDDTRNFWIANYGFDNFGKLFTERQLHSLNTFSGLVAEAKTKAYNDHKAAFPESDENISSSYSDAVATYLAFGVDRAADYWSSNATWESGGGFIAHVFTKQALPMVWDYAEGNPFSTSTGNWLQTCMDWIVRVINTSLPAISKGFSTQEDAAVQKTSLNKVISTDPPYFDNISYADLSDYFYPWMRKSLKSTYPKLFGTIAVPKVEELIASPYRQGSKEGAENFFMSGMTDAMTNMAESSHPAFPVTIYYAFKQSDTKGDGTASTGWETFLEAVITAGFLIDGTWPIRTERGNRSVGIGTNALASSIILVCRRRLNNSETISRRQFQRELRDDMPEALEAMIGGNQGVSPIAPVDLAQAAIGPGIAIFSKYESILEADGSKMSVHEALILINRAITDYLNPDSGNFDADTLFCDDWFSQYGWSAGSYGEADTLARAKGTSVDGVRDAGVVESGGGKVRLLKWGEYPSDWDPKADTRTPIWEACHQMIRVLNKRGEVEAGVLLARMPELGEPIRQLAYHLYTLCERKKWAEEARAYNELIASWHAIVTASHDAGHRGSQTELGLDF
tara:strand:+ start:19609 stop:22503 length:2895 start_codon:yes stop_codon:yes gene_type:complete